MPAFLFALPYIFKVTVRQAKMLVQSHSPNTSQYIQCMREWIRIYSNKWYIIHPSIDSILGCMYILPLQIHVYTEWINKYLYITQWVGLPSPYEMKKWVNALGLNQSKWKYFLSSPMYSSGSFRIYTYPSSSFKKFEFFSHIFWVIFAYLCELCEWSAVYQFLKLAGIRGISSRYTVLYIPCPGIVSRSWNIW